METKTEKLLKFSNLNKQQLNKLYKGVLKALQESARENNGEAFQLLEGTVRKHKSGVYIFTPNKHVKELLENADYSALMKIEESRFLDLLKLALQEID